MNMELRELSIDRVSVVNAIDKALANQLVQHRSGL